MKFMVLAMLWAQPAVADDPDDDDGDGYGESNGDCDDTDPEVGPYAPEVCDGKDNDCDELIDEGTECGDDDHDGQTEEEGDCDDADPEVYAGAPEQLNGIDDDCNGVIDDGTAAFDDDGDGYTELEGDCDDSDWARSPAQTEWCRDQLDNDCNGLVDEEECLEHPADGCDPELALSLSTSVFSAQAGTEIEAIATPHFDDGALEPALLWTVDAGAIDGTEERVFWTLPAHSGPATITVRFGDACGHQAQAEAEVDVQAIPTEIDEDTGGEPTGCAAVGGAAVGGGWAALGLLGLRRRRDSPGGS